MDHILKTETIEGVAYELHRNGRIRVFDVDAQEVVHMVFYPSMEAAVGAYEKLVIIARKVS